MLDRTARQKTTHVSCGPAVAALDPIPSQPEQVAALNSQEMMLLCPKHLLMTEFVESGVGQNCHLYCWRGCYQLQWARAAGPGASYLNSDSETILSFVLAVMIFLEAYMLPYLVDSTCHAKHS